MYYLSLHIGTETLGALQVGLLFHKSLSLSLHVLLSVCLQNCEKRRTIRRTALNNAISETSLPVTEYDTFFETPINTRRHTVDDDVRVALQQHGYWRVFFFYSRHKFIRLSHFEFHLYRSVYFTDPFLFNCTSTPHSSASFPTDNCRASLHTSILHLFSSIPDNFAICTTQ